MTTRSDAKPFYTDWAGNALAGAGVLGIGIGTTLLVVTLAEASSARSAERYDDFSRDAEGARMARVAAAIAAGVGVALLAGGIVRYATR